MSLDLDELAQSSSAWGEKDAASMEQILSAVTDDGVPRMPEALKLLAQALGKEENLVMALDSCDAVLTDAVRCILCHPWLVGSVERKNSEGEVVPSFFTQPFGNGRVLNIFSSKLTFKKLEAEAAKAGAKLTAATVSFGEIMMVHIPSMTLEAMRTHKIPEENAVLALAFDPLAFWDPALDDDEDLCDGLVFFSATTFSLLQHFCMCYALAGSVLELSASLRRGPVKPLQWKGVLCKQPLSAIMTAGDAVFATEQGMLLFCYPGDASKVLSFHQRNGVLNPLLDLSEGHVTALDPATFQKLIELHADQGISTLIVATALAQGGKLQLHGLSILPKVYLESAKSAVQSE